MMEEDELRSRINGAWLTVSDDLFRALERIKEEAGLSDTEMLVWVGSLLGEDISDEYEEWLRDD